MSRRRLELPSSSALLSPDAGAEPSGTQLSNDGVMTSGYGSPCMPQGYELGFVLNTAFGYIRDHTHGPYYRYQGGKHTKAHLIVFAYSTGRPGKALEEHECLSRFSPRVARLAGLTYPSPSNFWREEKKRWKQMYRHQSGRAHVCACIYELITRRTGVVPRTRQQGSYCREEGGIFHLLEHLYIHDIGLGIRYQRPPRTDGGGWHTKMRSNV